MLLLFSAPLSVLILRALADGPMRLADLRREVGGPAPTTLRGNLGNLAGVGALARRRRAGKPNTVENELTPFGRELLSVADVLEAWLARAPGGPIALGSDRGRGAIKALAGGWGSTILRALAARPLSLTELDRLIGEVSYPALERRLATMRLAGQVEALEGEGKGRPYTVTDWVRRGIAPLVVAARGERLHIAEETAPIARIDIEAAFLLVTPLVRLPASAGGPCQLEVDVGEGAAQHAAGVHVTMKRGRVASCVTRLKSRPPARAFAPTAAWLEAIIDGNPDGLHIVGDRRLTLGLVDGLHEVLFRP